MIRNLGESAIEDRIGISTHFMPATHGETVFDAIDMVKKAGFTGFELVPSLDQAQLGYPHNHANVGFDLWEASDTERARLKSALSVFDWVTIHCPHLDWNIASANRHLRRISRDYYNACLEFGVEIGTAAVTYHLGNQTFGFIRDNSVARECNVNYAREASAMAVKAGMPMGYEAGSLAELRYVCDQVEGWGINLDIGHAWMSARTDDGFFEYINQLGSRIVEVHHNGVNQYWGGFMEHQPPHMNNTLDFQRVYEQLREINYEGPIVCEIQGQDIPQVIEHCQESKEMICGIWSGTRTLGERWNV